MNSVPTLLLDDSQQIPSHVTDVTHVAAMAAALVGTRGIEEVVQQIRQSMLNEALNRSQGNRTHAANLLGVTRQAVQQMVGRYDLHRTPCTVLEPPNAANDATLG